MSPEDHGRFREMIGAFLLGDLDDEERAAVQAHVDGCPACQDEIRELRPVVEALSDASPEALAEGPSPPANLEERTFARISEDRRARRRERLRRSAFAAAAAVALVAAALAVVPRLLAPEVPLEPVSFSTTAPGVNAEANLVAHTWGTETKLVASGLDDDQTYRVVLLTEDDTRVSSGSFIGTGDEEIECSLNAALSRSRATALEVRSSDGDLILGADL